MKYLIDVIIVLLYFITLNFVRLFTFSYDFYL